MGLLNGKLALEGLTFDDVLLLPAYSEVLPKETNVSTVIGPNVTLNIPILSAAMDTVTESAMAIELARQGGIGVIHKNMSIEKQASEVKRVKRSQSGMITDPVTLTPGKSLKEADEIMRYYKISGLPVVDSSMRLLGIITNRDLKYREDLSVAVETVMTKAPLVTAPVSTTLETAKSILLEHKIEKLPIVKGDMLQGLITIKDIDKAKSYPHAAKDKEGRLLVGAALGVSEDSLVRAQALFDAGVDIITIDSAHGHSEGVLNTIRMIKKALPQLPVIGGNIATKEAAQALIDAGADCLKVGVGPGSICTTRVIAGVGIPQITAINEVYQIAKQKHIPVIADGGIQYSGDITKAIAAGASAVMLGGLLAGTDAAPGEMLLYQGRRFKVYQGMGSISAMKRGSSDRYFQGDTVELNKLVAEGIEGRVPYKGALDDVIYQLIGGLRSGMGYCGTKSIPDLIQHGQFVKITSAGQKESHPHHVEMTQEAPNYQK